MKIKGLELENFTNYEKEKVIFSDYINVIVGNNGAGKSNIIESIYYFSTIKSIRNKFDRELMKWKKEDFRIHGDFQNKILNFEVEVKYEKNKKNIYFNKCKIEKIKEYLGHIFTVYFSPEDLNIIKGDPKGRRDYIDNQLIQIKKDHFILLYYYKKYLSQRNALLKKYIFNDNIEYIKEVIYPWDEKIAHYGSLIIYNRLTLCTEIKEISKQVYREISGLNDEFTMIYENDVLMEINVNAEDNKFKEEIKEKYLDILRLNLRKDLSKGTTNFGPHRDDINFRLNKKSLKKYGSQGQQRTGALSIKISQLEYFYKVNGEYPILLLDDVLSELDNKRKDNLIKYLNLTQTIITATDINGIFHKNIRKKMNIIKIKEGKVING